MITDTVTARKPDGSRTMAYSLPANAYGSWAIATLWSPREFRNAEALTALQTLTKQSFGFDKDNWRRWWSAQTTTGNAVPSNRP